MRFLAVTNSTTGGDWPSVAELALSLSARGHDVHLIGDAPVLDALSDTSVALTEWPAELRLTRFRSFAEGAPREERMGRMHTAWAEASREFGAEAARRFGAQAVISQLLCAVPARAFAEEAGVPWVFVNPSYYLGPNPARPITVDWPEMGPGLERTLVPVIESADLVLHATDPTFDLVPANLPVNHHYIGPLLWSPPGPTPSYLDDAGPSWALVSLSTAAMPNEEELASAVVQALAGHPLRVLMTGQAAVQADALGAYSDNVHVERFVPHDSVLRNAALLVSHGGHGVVMRAMQHGVPMVLVPWGRDQAGVAARAERLGVARVVPRSELSIARLSGAVADVLANPRVVEASLEAKTRLSRFTAADDGAHFIEELVDDRQPVLQPQPRS